MTLDDDDLAMVIKQAHEPRTSPVITEGGAALPVSSPTLLDDPRAQAIRRLVVLANAYLDAETPEADALAEDALADFITTAGQR